MTLEHSSPVLVNDFSQRVKQAIDVGTFKIYLPDLRKAGSKYSACCPLHNDSHPSLSVEFKRDAWVWFCHPCNKGGDLFTLVREKFNLSFPEALERIATDLHILKTATKFVFDAKRASELLVENVVAMTGLAERGISPDTAKVAGLGLVNHPGIGLSISVPYKDAAVVKLRALAPKTKGDKFRHLNNAPSAHLLYGIEQLENDFFDIFSEVHITESELDSLTMRQAGFATLSVSSATTCINPDGSLKIIAEHLKELEKAEKVFLWFDHDAAGQKCADAFEKVLPDYKTFRVTWPYGGKDTTDAKDTGELYTKAPEDFRQTINRLRDNALNRQPAWRALFKAKSEMDAGEMKFLIDGFLPEGVTFFGARSGSGKTWFCLSMAKALTTGEKFLGHFGVQERVNVVYLIPESGERSFRGRLDSMGISDERFLCRTMRDGLLKLDDPLLLRAIRELKPVVFLDTAIRFSEAESENDASQNASGMAGAVFNLLAAGAQAVVGVHHAPKDVAKKDMTLENTLRGSGDLGAMCDSVYALKILDKQTLRVQVENVKARDFEPVPMFSIQGRPFINETQNFGLLASIEEPVFQKKENENKNRFLKAIEAQPYATFTELEDILDMSRRSIQRLAAGCGWEKNRLERWSNSVSGSIN
jgi:5S rRNA maturation endonuclease (ribonuclease M5)